MRTFKKSCGVGKERCDKWDSKSESKCSIYSDRNLCLKSLKQARHASATSRRNKKFPGCF